MMFARHFLDILRAIVQLSSAATVPRLAVPNQVKSRVVSPMQVFKDEINGFSAAILFCASQSSPACAAWHTFQTV